jgi:hypothetical protein
MVCLAAIRNGDAVVQNLVQLFGPQITPGALREWERLSKQHGFKLFIHYADGDFVPRLSMAYSAEHFYRQLTGRELVSSLREVASETDGLKNAIRRYAPSASASEVPCGSRRYYYSLRCHELSTYRKPSERPDDGTQPLSPAERKDLRDWLNRER